jgi:hypothetical protein
VFYILDEEKQTVPIEDPRDWAAWLEQPHNRLIKRTEVDSQVLVVTIFLGMDLNFTGEGYPILFETVVIGGIHDGLMERDCDYAGAVLTHETMCRDLYRENQ